MSSAVSPVSKSQPTRFKSPSFAVFSVFEVPNNVLEEESHLKVEWNARSSQHIENLLYTIEIYLRRWRIVDDIIDVDQEGLLTVSA